MITFSPEQFEQLLDLLIITNIIVLLCALLTYDVIKSMVLEFLNEPRHTFRNFKIRRALWKSYRRLNFEDYYRNLKDSAA